MYDSPTGIVNETLKMQDQLYCGNSQYSSSDYYQNWSWKGVLSSVNVGQIELGTYSSLTAYLSADKAQIFVLATVPSGCTSPGFVQIIMDCNPPPAPAPGNVWKVTDVPAYDGVKKPRSGSNFQLYTSEVVTCP
jgi:hypothetical protein